MAEAGEARLKRCTGLLCRTSSRLSLLHAVSKCVLRPGDRPRDPSWREVLTDGQEADIIALEVPSVSQLLSLSQSYM